MIGNESPILRNLNYVANPEIVGQDDDLEGFSLSYSRGSTRIRESEEYCEDVPVVRVKTAQKEKQNQEKKC